MIIIKLNMNLRYFIELVIYLIIFPVVGSVAGYVFYLVYEFIGNEPSDFHLKLFVVMWGVFGFLAGIYGVYLLIKFRKQLK